MNPHALRRVPPPPPPEEYRLWLVAKHGHAAECRVRATPFGTELRILIDGELWWSHLYPHAPTDWLAAEADRKRAEFAEKGWA